MGKILIIDDNHVQRRLCELALMSEGYEVITAHSGMAALMEIELSMPDIAVLDLMIKDTDGIELLGKIVTNHRNLPVIIHTTTDELKDNFMTWCADAYVLKSADHKELKCKIRKLLDKSKNVYA